MFTGAMKGSEMMKPVGVILCGCGTNDGSEILETVLDMIL